MCVICAHTGMCVHNVWAHCRCEGGCACVDVLLDCSNLHEAGSLAEPRAHQFHTV